MFFHKKNTEDFVKMVVFEEFSCALLLSSSVACLPACPLARLPACSLACLLSYLLACFLACFLEQLEQLETPRLLACPRRILWENVRIHSNFSSSFCRSTRINSSGNVVSYDCGSGMRHEGVWARSEFDRFMIGSRLSRLLLLRRCWAGSLSLRLCCE